MLAAVDHRKHLLGLDSIDRSRLVSLLERARSFDDGTGRAVREGSHAKLLRGRNICNLFFEDSTRTRVSFSLAATNLGAGVIDLTAPGSSVAKGETIIDTANVVEATGGDALVIRAGAPGAAQSVAGHVGVPVINAGDGAHEHPTQGLLDIYALAAAHGRADSFDLSGLTVAIVGDIISSRVARSDIFGMSALGARVICVGPPTLAPPSLVSLGCAVSSDLDAVLGEVDGVQMLRLQFERHGGGSGPKVPPGVGSLREYRALYSLTAERATWMKPGAVVMHPGPVNRGLELDGSVADAPNSIVLKQVAAGVLVRMAVLAELLGG
ncbi:MAG: aspartate carbamoyltransferase catalytic subunit [Planctomycetota bacterium]